MSNTGTVYCYEVLSSVDMAQSPFTDNLFKLVGERALLAEVNSYFFYFL